MLYMSDWFFYDFNDAHFEDGQGRIYKSLSDYFDNDRLKNSRKDIKTYLKNNIKKSNFNLKTVKATKEPKRFKNWKGRR